MENGKTKKTFFFIIWDISFFLALLRGGWEYDIHELLLCMITKWLYVQFDLDIIQKLNHTRPKI